MDALRSTLVALQQQAAALETGIATREAPVRARLRPLEAQRDVLAAEVLELEARVARFSAEGRAEAPSPPALSARNVTAFSLAVGCLVALSFSLWDDRPRVLMAAALLTVVGALRGYFRAR